MSKRSARVAAGRGTALRKPFSSACVCPHLRRVRFASRRGTAARRRDLEAASCDRNAISSRQVCRRHRDGVIRRSKVRFEIHCASTFRPNTHAEGQRQPTADASARTSRSPDALRRCTSTGKVGRYPPKSESMASDPPVLARKRPRWLPATTWRSRAGRRALGSGCPPDVGGRVRRAEGATHADAHFAPLHSTPARGLVTE